MPRLARLILLVLPALALGLPGVATATSPPEEQAEQASLGAVAASFVYHDAGDGRWDDLRIAITRDGQLAYDDAAQADGCEAPYCAPGSLSGQPALKVADLDADGEPEVIVDLLTGGAHCCVVAEILRWTGSGYARTTRNFADAGYALQASPAPGVPMTFVTGDTRFAYAFSSFADSRFPVRLLTFTAGRWRDVTRAHPETLRAESSRLLREYRRVRQTHRALGILAAWVADQWRLGRRVQASRFLTRELHAGRLRNDPPWPKRLGYIASLTRRLAVWGYAPRPRG